MREVTAVVGPVVIQRTEVAFKEGAGDAVYELVLILADYNVFHFKVFNSNSHALGQPLDIVVINAAAHDPAAVGAGGAVYLFCYLLIRILHQLIKLLIAPVEVVFQKGAEPAILVFLLFCIAISVSFTSQFPITP